MRKALLWLLTDYISCNYISCATIGSSLVIAYVINLKHQSMDFDTDNQ